MQITVEDLERVSAEDVQPQQVLSIPLFGLMTGSLISLTLWGALFLTYWEIAG